MSHVEFGLKPHYHIDADWRHNVKYEHKFEGKVYNYTPEQEVNYLYRKRWQEPYYKKDASLEYMMQCLVKEGVYEPVAMHFRNARIQEFEECPDGVLDVYHRRNCSEGINSYMKDYLGLETHINGKLEKYRPSCNRVQHSDTCSSFDEITTWNNRKYFFSCLFDLERFE
ncbi:MAG: hypothetical protein SCH70_09760 [Candidatus Methanoperedens sp.]|nr:hypothetical protein [Candidatus Methanoperedens sp.]